jgi:glyoxylase-like metal-dependent hydrolase (beta-lactamase superfamily II)
MKFGSFEIIPFVERRFRLDGGSMFGIVPKIIWSRLIDCDEDNRVPMQTNLFVLKANNNNILFDTGFGDCLKNTEKKIYAVKGETAIESGLKEIGLMTDDINFVFLSHLHTDHAAGAVKSVDGKYVPRFGRARYIVQKIEWDDAMNPNERTSAVYIPDRLSVLKDAGQLELIDGDTELMPGVKMIRTGGHTPGHQAIEAISDGTTVVYYADIIPSLQHIKIPYVAAVDLDPLRTMEVKRKLLNKLCDINNAIVFDHDISIKIGKLSKEDGKVTVGKIA